MSSQELDNIIKIAKEAGLQGKDLADYIREERVALRNAEKEERQKEKEDERRKEKEDREERQKERDREDARKEKAAALEIEKIKLEAVERDKERETIKEREDKEREAIKEREDKEREAIKEREEAREREAEKVRQHELTMANLRNNVAATVGQPKEMISAGPKLPLFDEDTDDMGA
jgi:hypothetical protein